MALVVELMTEVGNYTVAIHEAVSSETGLCDDTRDNDGDGLVDCDDDECAGAAGC